MMLLSYYFKSNQLKHFSKILCTTIDRIKFYQDISITEYKINEIIPIPITKSHKNYVKLENSIPPRALICVLTIKKCTAIVYIIDI